jgi:hypothetical protein
MADESAIWVNIRGSRIEFVCPVHSEPDERGHLGGGLSVKRDSETTVVFRKIDFHKQISAR